MYFFNPKNEKKQVKNGEFYESNFQERKWDDDRSFTNLSGFSEIK